MTGSGKSKYLEIKEQIESQILAGSFPPGNLLPSEPRLAEVFNASRGTIRHALSALERDGIVARRSGLGTTVVRRPKQAHLLSFSEQARLKGKISSTRLISLNRMPIEEAEGRATEAFILDPNGVSGVFVYRIERLRLANEIPVASQVVFLSAEDFNPNLIEIEDFTNSLFKIYERQGRHPSWANEIIKARRPTSEEIQLLTMDSLPPSDRIVYVRDRITYDNENMPLEVLRSIDRADFFDGYCYRLLSER